MKQIILLILIISFRVQAYEVGVQFSINDNGVTEAALSSNSISSGKLIDSSITHSKIQNNIIDDSKVNSISSNSISDFISSSVSAITSSLLNYLSKSELSNSITKGKFQRKSMSIESLSPGFVPALRFNNLTIGKTYKVNLNCYFDGKNTGASGFEANVYNGASAIPNTQITMQHGEPDERFANGFSTIFVATASTVDFNLSQVYGLPTWVSINFEIEELPFHEQTTQFN